NNQSRSHPPRRRSLPPQQSHPKPAVYFDSLPDRRMAKEQFFHPESADLLKTLDEAADRSGLSRGQAFDDFLNMVVCSLSGGRMVLAVAEIRPHWLFVGRDIDLRCVRMTAINLALRNLFGFVIWGNSLADERRLVYRTGFDLKGFISEVSLGDLPEPVQRIAT